MFQITIGDVTRDYKEAKGVNIAEVAKGQATACRALPATSTTYPGAVVSTLMQKTKGGSGTLAAQIRVNDTRVFTNADSATVNEVTNIAIDISQRPSGEASVAYVCALLTAVVNELTASGGVYLQELFSGMHRE